MERGGIRRIEPSGTGDGRPDPFDAVAGERPEDTTVPRPSWTPPSRREAWLRSGARPPPRRLALGSGLLVVLALAWLWVGRDHSPERVAIPTTTLSTTPVGQRAPKVDAVVSVPRWVPDAIAATCRAHRSDATAVVTVDCTPGRGVVALQYRAFPSVAAVRAAYATAAVIAGGAGPAGCAGGTQEERSWSSPESPAVPSGRYRCSVVGRQARLVWTSEHDRVLTVATRDDGDLRSLFAWWTTVPGPDAP